MGARNKTVTGISLRYQYYSLLMEFYAVGAVANSTNPKKHGLLVRGYLDEAVVEREAVSYGVLPALSVVVIVGERARDELVDVRQRRHA